MFNQEQEDQKRQNDLRSGPDPEKKKKKIGSLSQDIAELCEDFLQWLAFYCRCVRHLFICNLHNVPVNLTEILLAKDKKEVNIIKYTLYGQKFDRT